MKLTFLTPLTGLICGIYISSEIMHGVAIPMICIGLSLTVWWIYRTFATDSIKLHKFRKLNTLWIFLIFAGIGAIDFNFNSRAVIPSDLGGKLVNVRGEIYECRNLAKGDVFKIKILSLTDDNHNGIKTRNAGLLVKTNGFCGRLGETIEFKARLHELQGYGSAGERYSNQLKRNGINYYVDVKSDQINKTGRSLSLLTISDDIKNDLIIRLEKSKLKKDCKQFIISLLLGEKSYISTQQREILSKAGLGHMLALSGLHVGIVLSILMLILFPISIIGKPILRSLIALTLLWIYVGITGWAPSTVRAALMASFIIAAFCLQRKNSSLNALLAAVTIILLIRPEYLWDLGLQLSFISVASILLFVSKLNVIDRHNHPRLYSIMSLMVVTIVATFSTWMLTAYYFNSVPLLFLPANLLLLPLLPLFITGSMLYLLLLCLHFDFNWLARGLELFTEMIFKGARVLSADGSSSLPVNVNQMSVILWMISLLLAGIAFYSVSKTKRKVFSWASLGFFGVSLLLIVINAGQENAVYIRFPHSFTSMDAHIIEKDATHKMTFERNQVSTADFGTLKLIVIDGKILPDRIELITENEHDKMHFLYLGPGAEFDQVAELNRFLNFEKIILHPGIGKAKKSQLSEVLPEESRDNIYSLGEKGSLEFSL